MLAEYERLRLSWITVLASSVELYQCSGLLLAVLSVRTGREDNIPTFRGKWFPAIAPDEAVTFSVLSS